MRSTDACKIESPRSWKGYHVQWVGSCVQGRADGYGVMRGSVSGKVAEIYFGRANEGRLAIGVIETKDGYVAGRFSGGVAVLDGDRSTNVLAFDEAVKGAKQARDYYVQQKNAASARFYAAKAEALSKQMD